MSTKAIKLETPIQWFDSVVKELRFTAPTGLHYMKYGEPRLSVISGDGAYWIEKDDVVKSYVGDLLTLPDGEKIDGGDAILRALSLADCMRIKETLFGFFTDARSATSAPSSISSSSDS